MWLRACIACFAVLPAGCLGPMVDDDKPDAGAESLLLPPGSEVPSLHDDPELDDGTE